MSVNRFNWGVPDWSNGEGYPAPDANTTLWRWQFLRRRQDYREDWLLYFEQSYRRNIEIYRSIPLSEGVTSWADHFSRMAEMPDIVDEESGVSICGHIVKYEVSFLLDPSGEDPGLGLFQRPKRAQFLRLEERHLSKRHWYAEVIELLDTLERAGLERKEAGRMIGAAMREERREIRKEAGIFSYEFDLTEPLSPQFKHAKILLGNIQKELYGSARKLPEHRAKWPLYLRVLDAREAGDTYQTIGETLMDMDPDLKDGNLMVEQFDRAVDRADAAKSWAKKQHDQALKVAFFGFR